MSQTEFREEIAKFLQFHENHLNFYKCVWQKSKSIEVCSSNLKNVVVRLIEGATVINTELATITGLMENSNRFQKVAFYVYRQRLGANIFYIKQSLF